MEKITNWKQLYGKTIAEICFIVAQNDPHNVHMKMDFTDRTEVYIPFSTQKVNTDKLLETLLAKHN